MSTLVELAYSRFSNLRALGSQHAWEPEDLQVAEQEAFETVVSDLLAKDEREDRAA